MTKKFANLIAYISYVRTGKVKSVEMYDQNVIATSIFAAIGLCNQEFYV